MADTTDSKSVVEKREGSSPSSPITYNDIIRSTIPELSTKIHKGINPIDWLLENWDKK